MNLKQREHGAEHPYWKLGVFKVRLPFIHYRIELPEAIQGIVIVTVSMGAIAAQQEVLGIPYDLGILMVSLNTLLYFLHPTFGDAVFPGWITPAIPLITAWALTFGEGTPRIQAIIALQFTMAFVFLFLGITGLAKKVMRRVPTYLRGGIILGSGVSAVMAVFKTGGRISTNMWSIIIGCIFCYALMNAEWYANLAKKNPFLMFLRKLGMIPGILVGYVVGSAVGEIAAPVIQHGIIPFGRWGEIISGYTIFGVGFPGVSFFISAIPVAVSCYIIAFGDFVLAESVAMAANKERDDELIEFNTNRSNIIAGARNLIMGLVSPYVPMCGPLWAGGTMSVSERYKSGRAQMDCIWSGLGTYILFNFLATLSYTIMSFFSPIYTLGLSLTYLVQAFGCGYVAMDMLKAQEEKGMGLVTGAVLASMGAAWGLGVGIALYFVVGLTKKTKEMRAAESRELIAAEAEKAAKMARK